MSESQALNDALAANYLLVDLRLRSWAGKTTDKTASNEVLSNHSSVSDGGAFVKNLLAGAKQELKEVHALGNALRSFVYGKTLAWSPSQDGARRGERLLPSSQAMDFLRELNSIKQEYDRAVLGLVAVWPTRVAEAMRNLGTLANADDYPDASALPSMFAVTVDLKPVPAVADFQRLNVPAELADALGQRSAQQAEIQVANAMREMQERFAEELARVAGQFSKHANGEKTRLYSTLITNMQGLVDMARNMNLNNNPKLTDLADRIEQKLLQLPIEAYRDDPVKAAVAADAAKQFAEEVSMEDVWH